MKHLENSKILITEDIDSSLGKGKLFTFERSNPAASNNPKTWNEIHAIIPINNNNMAFDIWGNVKKDTLINILKVSIKEAEQHLSTSSFSKKQRNCRIL